jgi:hypothetical protein
MTDDMEALIERVALPWLEAAEQSFDTDELTEAGQAVRTLLKAYQEQRRALEVARHALVCTENLRCTDQSIEALAAKLVNGVPRDQLEFMTNFASELAVIDAALNQKGDER